MKYFARRARPIPYTFDAFRTHRRILPANIPVAFAECECEFQVFSAIEVLFYPPEFSLFRLYRILLTLYTLNLQPLSSANSMNTTIQAILPLKRDVESKDDERLALMELESISGSRPRRVSGKEASSVLGLPKPLKDLQKHDLYAVDISSNKVDPLAQRLAFWESVVCKTS